MTKGRLEGQAALVTGASSGIGEATALALAAEGARVALVARRADRLEALSNRIKENGGRALPVVADATDEAQLHGAVNRANEEFGRLDILINNAGVMLVGSVADADTEDWRRMVNLNLLGLMYATHAALPLMKRQGGGHIVNLSSVAGRVSNSPFAVYSATKWGVGAFSEALRQEVHKDNIRVTIIEPGAVGTELTGHITDAESKKAVEGMYNSMNVLQSEDIASAILYAVTQPARVSISEIFIRPTEQQI